MHFNVQQQKACVRQITEVKSLRTSGKILGKRGAGQGTQGQCWRAAQRRARRGRGGVEEGERRSRGEEEQEQSDEVMGLTSGRPCGPD